jgi:hypothetical protein
MRGQAAQAEAFRDRRWNNRWYDLSLEAITRDHQHDLAVLEQLKSINRARSPNEVSRRMNAAYICSPWR